MSDRSLPPLTALRAFEVAARYGSFTHAAGRLCSSQSAVTRQIAMLEASVGAKLFQRGRRGVQLTARGQTFFEEVSPAFEMIAAATSRLRRSGSEGVLRLRVYPTFALKWLVPRLGALQAWAPSVTVELDTRIAEVDFQRTSLDAAIQFGAGDRADVHSEPLLTDEIEPVCSPALFGERDTPPDLDELNRFPLLHARYRRADWSDWARSAGRAEIAEAPGQELPSSVLVYEAAAAGLGVAMGQTQLLAADFARGTLVRPFDRPLRRAMAYHLLTPLDRAPPLRVRLFQAWLKNELGRPAQ